MQKWNKWLWIVIALVISSGIYFSIRYGLRPKPIPILKPTEFASFEEMGIQSYRRLRPQIRSEKIVVLGTDLERPETVELWAGLVKAALNDKVRIQTVYSDSRLQLPESLKELPNQVFEISNMEGLRNDLLRGRRRDGLVVILTGHQDSSHLNPNSLTKTIERSAIGPILSLSPLSLVLDPEVLNEMSEACADLDLTDFQSRSGCIVFRFARQYQRRKLDPTKLIGAIERYGLKEYLIFIHQPPSGDSGI